MRTCLTIKTCLVAAGLASLALTAAPAQAMTPAPTAAVPASVPQCVPDHCDVLIEYYSDATYTVRVGEYEDGFCGQIDWGTHTQYIKTFRQYC